MRMGWPTNKYNLLHCSALGNDEMYVIPIDSNSFSYCECDDKFTDHFHFFPIMAKSFVFNTCVHQVLLINCGTANIAPCILEHLSCGFFYWDDFQGVQII